MKGLKERQLRKLTKIPTLLDEVHRLVGAYDLNDKILYSSFSAKSLETMREIDRDVEIGVLDTRISDCLYKLKGGCGANALHPYWKGIDLPKEGLDGYTVRAWFGGHLYPEKPTGSRLNLTALEARGITDVFLNEPEMYLQSCMS